MTATMRKPPRIDDETNGNGSLDPTAAQAALDADKERRAKEFASILQREAERLRCDVIAVAEIAGTQVQTQVKIVAR